MEPFEAAPDLVGRTSARLLAAGVDRRERLDALRLLAILDASTDIEGFVRRPLDDLAAEFDLHPLEVIRSLEHLEAAGAVQRADGRLEVLNTGVGLGGMQLADFLDDVRASFADDDVAIIEPASVPSRTSRWLSRAGAGLVAVAAAAAVITLSPTGGPTTLQPAAIGSSTTVPSSTETTEGIGPDELVFPSTTAGIAPTPGTDAPAVVDTTVAAATCPAEEPVAEVIEDIVRITNPFDHDIAVSVLTVGGITITSPITIPAGGHADWPVVATLTDGPPSVGAWEFTDPSVARTCPS